MDRKTWMLAVGVMGIAHIFVACQQLEPLAPKEDAVLDGPVEGLTGEENEMHLRGDVAFNDEVFTPGTGLGPRFVATSCGSCHAGDGKGHPFTTLTRFGQSEPGVNAFTGTGGPQLQNRAIPGFTPEQLPPGAPFAKFTPPINTGLGFLDLVSDADILAMADPADADHDGISGEPNWIVLPAYARPRAGAITQGGRYIGRFGKKANAYDLLQQTVQAYSEDIGIASAFLPVDVYSQEEIDPEVSNATVNVVVFYLKTLKAPVQRNRSDPDVLAGEKIFTDTQCAGCHSPRLKTGPSPISALSQKTFAPYTDLLLHDMGPGLNDGYTEGNARASEWRTPPLWGLGLAPNSQGGEYFLLHDGRARSIEGAILLHSGEASRSVDRFRQLSPAERQQLITFLESL